MDRNEKEYTSQAPAGDFRQPRWIADPNQDEPLPQDTPGRTRPAAPCDEPLPGMPRQALGQVELVEARSSRLMSDREPMDDQALEQASAELEALLKSRDKGLWGLGWLKHLVLALAGLGLVVLVTQALSFMTLLATLPAMVRYPGYALMGLLSLWVIWSLGRFVVSYLHMQRSPRVSLEALRSLERRSSLRRQAHNLLNEARNQLKRLLESYPLETEKGRAQLASLGFAPEDLKHLAKAKARLLNTVDEESTEAWIMQFDLGFASILDKTAKKRITRHAWLVGVKTAAAPTGFLSAAIVLINAYQLMGELCRIYRLRSGGVGTASILVRIFINAFAASQMEEWMDHATQGIIGSAATGGDAAAAFFKILAGGVMSRAAEGGANAFLLVRLGAAGMHYLRPVSEKTR